VCWRVENSAACAVTTAPMTTVSVFLNC
jgi:hypothetical protein